MQEKFVRLFMSIAAELWLRDAIDTVEEVFTHAARNFTLRDSGNPPANLGCFVAGSAHADSCSFAQWAHSVGRLTCSDVAVKSSV